MRRWLVLLAAVTLMTGLMGCQGPTKWHECTDCELKAARSDGDGASNPSPALRADDPN